MYCWIIRSWNLAQYHFSNHQNIFVVFLTCSIFLLFVKFNMEIHSSGLLCFFGTFWDILTMNKKLINLLFQINYGGLATARLLWPLQVNSPTVQAWGGRLEWKSVSCHCISQCDKHSIHKLNIAWIWHSSFSIYRSQC